jgi:hypothetical protein
MTFLSYLLTGILFLLLLGFVGGSIWLLKAWREAPERTKKEYQKEVNGQAFTLLFLLLLTISPPIAAGFLGIGIFPIIALATGSILWGALTVWFWDRRAAPLEAGLISPGYPEVKPYPPYRPHLPGPIIRPGLPLNPVPVPNLEGDDLIHKSFHWVYRGKTEINQSFEMDISQGRYERYRSEPRLREVKDWKLYVTEDMPEVRVLAAHFQNLHLQQEWSTFEQASNILSFAQQCVKYSYDQDTTPLVEWPRYPIETLMEETGDCEDTAILTAAILARLGFQAVLLEYPGHIAIGIAGAEGLPGTYIIDPKSRRYYFFAETTADGWHIGEIPDAYRGKPPERIIPIEILIQKDQATKKGPVS